MEWNPCHRRAFSGPQVAQSHRPQGRMGSLSLDLAPGGQEGVGPRPPGLAAPRVQGLTNRPPESASCQGNRARTNNGALVQTRFLASEVTL